MIDLRAGMVGDDQLEAFDEGCLAQTSYDLLGLQELNLLVS